MRHTTAIIVTVLIAALGTAIAAEMPHSNPSGKELERYFVDPPTSARLHPYWWWSNGNVSKEGITADLEAFQAAGMGGAIIFDALPIISQCPKGHPFMSSGWQEMFQHALGEAKRLGLTLSLNPVTGYCYGGAWAKPEEGFQRLVWQETKVKGPARYQGHVFSASGKLPGRLSAVMAIPALPPNSRPVALRDWDWKSGNRDIGRGKFLKFLPDTATPDTAEKAVDVQQVVDLTERVDAQGNLTWQVPDGEWTILALGHTFVGSRLTIPSAASSNGPHADYLNVAVTDKGFNVVVPPLLALDGVEAGTMAYIHEDSLECHYFNWTADFISQFQKRRGYDPRPYLPIMAGQIVGGRQIADRFLYDIRKTIGDLVADNHYGRLTELARQHGLQTHLQAGGAHFMMIDPLKCLGRVDIPMGEFWVKSPHRPTDDKRFYVKQEASAAHIYGKKRVMLEGFSAQRQIFWSKSPYEMKDSVDRAFCEGGNWIAPMQASARHDLSTLPGDVSKGGEEFNPNLTYWKLARPWFDYIARCSYLLQQGSFVADVLYYYGDQVPNRVPRKKIDPARGPGYDYDVINAEALLDRVQVKDGRLVLPDGMSYRLLVLPDRQEMPVEVLAKIEALVKSGATVIGPRPVRDPGLRDYPECDAKIEKMAAGLWGNCNGKTVRERRYGDGRIVWGIEPKEVLASMRVGPDFTYEIKSMVPQAEKFYRYGPKGVEVNTQPAPAGTWPATEPVIDFIHRRAGDMDLYFVANRSGAELTADCQFRVAGKQPEFWDAVQGTQADASAFRPIEGGTLVTLELAPRESRFVVFRRPLASEVTAASPKPTPVRELQTLDGPWAVDFDPAWGGPAATTFEKLTDWTRHPDEGIKYYSGTATYRKSFSFSKSASPDAARLLLDLGTVHDLAAVRLNGKPVGTVWCAPWQVEVTDAIVDGANRLEVDVVNLWPNRLIGDSQLPEEKRYTQTNLQQAFDSKIPLLPSGLLGPVTLRAAGH
ncbi:MAG: glycosyl transferase family 2 [Hyphomicrobiales bacterium]|nr:glycosyl transferase family 2 [Hyphomicrobiales bacterium]